MLITIRVKKKMENHIIILASKGLCLLRYKYNRLIATIIVILDKLKAKSPLIKKKFMSTLPSTASPYLIASKVVIISNKDNTMNDTINPSWKNPFKKFLTLIYPHKCMKEGGLYKSLSLGE